MKIFTQVTLLLVLCILFPLQSMKTKNIFKGADKGSKTYFKGSKHVKSGHAMRQYSKTGKTAVSKEQSLDATIKNAYNDIYIDRNVLDVDKYRERQKIEKAAEDVYSPEEIKNAFTDIYIDPNTLDIDKYRKRQEIIKVLAKKLKPDFAKTYFTHKKIMATTKKPFKQQRGYATQVGQNRNEEDIPWYKRWWRELVGGTVAAGLFSYAHQNSEKENAKQQPLDFSLPYLAQSITVDGNAVNLKEIFNTVSPSTPVETFYKDDNVECHFKIEKIIMKDWWGYNVDVIQITSTITTKYDIYEKIDTTTFSAPQPKYINTACGIGRHINDDGDSVGTCNCKIKFLQKNSNALLSLIK